MKKRPLHPYESMLSGSNITLAVQIQGSLSPEKLHQSLIETAKIHPYLQMEINFAPLTTEGVNPIFLFQERKTKGYDIYTETDSVTDFSWQDRLTAAANSTRVNTSALTRIQLFSDPTAPRHDLIIVFNHAGIDGVGVFFVLHILLQSLAKSTKLMEKPKSFHDILGRIPLHSHEIPNPNLPNEFLSPLCYIPVGTPDTPAQIKGVWLNFSEQESEKLLNQCRDQECTIQAAINTAEMVAILNSVKEKSPLPQTIVHMVPVNMRPYVDPPLDLEDCVCGSSAVFWSQTVTASSGLWELTKDSTNKLKNEINRKAGLRWWHNIAAGNYFGPPTFMASSIGKTPIQSTYGELSIKSVKLLGGAYDKVLANQAGTMVHVYSVYNKLNITFAYTTPPISGEWAKKILSDMKTVLKMMLVTPKKDIELGQVLQQL